MALFGEEAVLLPNRGCLIQSLPSLPLTHAVRYVKTCVHIAASPILSIEQRRNHQQGMVELAHKQLGIKYTEIYEYLHLVKHLCMTLFSFRLPWSHCSQFCFVSRRTGICPMSARVFVARSDSRPGILRPEHRVFRQVDPHCQPSRTNPLRHHQSQPHLSTLA